VLSHYIPYIGHYFLLAHGQIVIKIDEEFRATHVDKFRHWVFFGHKTSDSLEKCVKYAVVEHGYFI
jgi:hypothetical protein